METTIAIEFEVKDESVFDYEDPSGKPYFKGEYQFFINGFNFDEFTGEELKDYIINELTKSI